MAKIPGLDTGVEGILVDYSDRAGILICIGNLTKHWVRNCLEFSHRTFERTSHSRAGLTFTPDSCHRKGLTSRLEYRNTIQVVSFALPPHDIEGVNRAKQTLPRP